MKENQHYYENDMYNLGKWSLLPGDSCSWHFIDSARAFKDTFGFGKGLLLIHRKDTGYQHCYVPVLYFKKLGDYLDKLRKDDYKGVEKKFSKFYPLKAQAKKELKKLEVSGASKLSNEELAERFKQIREWIHKITVYDQFGWLLDSSDYWEKLFDQVLVDKLGFKKGSVEYNELLFTLTKPEEISTTLEEKRAVLREGLAIKTGSSTIEKSAKKLAENYGWMPVFAYGDPWEAEHYESELEELLEKDQRSIENELEKLEKYTELRNKDIEKAKEKYGLTDEDIQVFVDFGLILDARNEAEYVLSFGTFFLLPLYEEISKRLHISIDQARYLNEHELLDCILGKQDPHKLLDKRRKSYSWGYNEDMDKVHIIPEDEAHKLHEHVEKNSVNASKKGEEEKGITASPGQVTGKAKLVPTPKDNHKVEAGDILITYATTVDYLPAMKKAAAFVTESGGLTCHAAVVAREFGVPCIVSYPEAMSKFEDGEEIELDADNGIIKKLNDE